jgi:hypothetical protein
MGTRSTTKIYLDDKLYLSLYKQYDGYVEDWGKELKDFFKSGKMVNGFPINSKDKLFNGVGCFALQLVTEFKEGVGDLYATTEEDMQEFNYTITFKELGEDGFRKITSVTFECLEDEDYREVFEIEQN